MANLYDNTRYLIGRIRRRRDGQRKWLRENHPECQKEQKHLDAGSVERAYWHYGYMVALSDILNQLTGERHGQPQ